MSIENLDIRSLAKKHLEDALTKGCITLEGETKELKPSEILGVAKYILKENLFSNQTKEMTDWNVYPTDIFKPLVEEEANDTD